MNRKLLSLNSRIIKYYRGSYFRLKKKKGNVSNILKDITIVNGWNRTSYAFNQRQFHFVRVFPRIRHKAGQTFFTFRKKKKWKNSRRTFPDEFIAHTLQRTDGKKKKIKNITGEKIKILFICPLSVSKFLTLISQIFNLFHNFR